MRPPSRRRPPRPSSAPATPVAIALAVLTAIAAASAARAGSAPDGAGDGWRFVDASVETGLAYRHVIAQPASEPAIIGGGVAAGDVDGDGWVDLYVVRGSGGEDLLLHNLGGSREAGAPVTFAPIAASQLGIADVFGQSAGPAFADVDGDGALDLLLGGIFGAAPRLFRNLGGAAPGFVEVTAESGLFAFEDTFGAAFGDYDRDGDLDLFLSHWQASAPAPHLWRNRGDATFEPVDLAAGVEAAFAAPIDYTFTPNFADIDDDGWPDLLVAADFGTSQVLRNRGPSAGGTVTFAVATTPVISDENGMGASVGDLDGDGDLDWFVTSIWDPDGVAEGNWGVTGNRLYRNRGDGTFEDATDVAGVRRGYWGWASCFADFDLDGDLDIFHTNGFSVDQASEFHADPSRLFINDGSGRFVELSTALGLVDTGQGRGVVCFDYDRDGDLDIFVANVDGSPRLYRNDLPPRRFLAVRLRGDGLNSEAIGARVTATAGGLTQMRELRAGSNFASQDPAVAHFGFGEKTERIDRLEIRWPDGSVEVAVGVAVDRELTLARGSVPGLLAIPALGPWGLAALALLLAALGAWRARRRHADG